MIPLMHVERTDDPDVVRWVVHDDRLRLVEPIRVDRDRAHDSPIAARVFVEVVEVVEIEIGHLRIDVRMDPGGSWQTLAPVVQSILREALEAGIPLTRGGSASANRATEVADAMDGASGTTVAARCGALGAADLDAECAAVRLHGACKGCPSARSTVRQVLGAERRPHLEHGSVASWLLRRGRTRNAEYLRDHG